MTLSELLDLKAYLEARLVWAKGELYWDTLFDLEEINKRIAALQAA